MENASSLCWWFESSRVSLEEARILRRDGSHHENVFVREGSKERYDRVLRVLTEQ